MKIKVEYIGPFGVKLKKRQEILEIPQKSTLKDLLNTLSDTYGSWFREEVFEAGGESIRDGTLVTVDGRAVGQTGLQTLLEEGVVVTLLPFFAGGG